MPTLGAVPHGEGRTAFRVWAPDAGSVAIELAGGTHDLRRGDDGVWEGELGAGHGDDYMLLVDGSARLADPCSAWQPGGLRGPSRVLDPGTFAWTDAGWRTPAAADLVILELHVGTFSAVGTFDGVVENLPELRDLGVNAIELMPVATFPGERGWGYDGVLLSAPHRAYGGPEGLARLVDAAHGHGLAVLLDVVYNHVGPGGDRLLGALGPYFTDRHDTPWGSALDYTHVGVREWAIQNAERWTRDFHVDGLRLDSVFHVFDDGPRHVLAELAERVRAVNPRAVVISEQRPRDLRPVETWGHEAQWADELHHEVHVALTGERDGYYASYAGTAAAVAAELVRQPPECFVVFGQNHDQVGNRAVGDRPAADELRLRAALTLFAPQIPLLFMGEEYGERRPFLFFSDHDDPFIADATREGRRREFAGFAGFAGEVPDPQARESFDRSRLDRTAADEELRSFYRELIALRRGLPRQTEATAEGDVVRVRRGSWELVADLAARTVDLRRI